MQDNSTSLSDKIRQRILQAGSSFYSNDNISAFFESETEREALKKEIELKIESLLQSLIIDTKKDPNVEKTAYRIAKMYVEEVFFGRYYPMPEVSEFPNTKVFDQLYLVGPVIVRSSCSHHMVPVIGKAWFGVIPGDKVLGISKFSRLADWVMSRPQIQEEATMMLGNLLQQKIKSKGLGVLIKAKHFCMHWRGVKEYGTTMSTSFFSGALKGNEDLKRHFFQLVESTRL